MSKKRSEKLAREREREIEGASLKREAAREYGRRADGFYIPFAPILYTIRLGISILPQPV